METRRFIIGGSSPSAFNLPREFLDTGVVIGLNKWFLKFPCKYLIFMDSMIMYDDHRILFDKNVFTRIGIQVYANICEPMPRNVDVHHWFRASSNPNEFQMKTTDTLVSTGTTAIPAIHLSLLLGATEVFLFGVDLTGTWQSWIPHIEPYMNKFKSTLVPIYKTLEESPLDLPFYDIRKDCSFPRR